MFQVIVVIVRMLWLLGRVLGGGLLGLGFVGMDMDTFFCVLYYFLWVNRLNMICYYSIISFLHIS